MQIEYKDEVRSQYEYDQLCAMEDYDGAPERDAADREKYDLKLPGQLPYLRFHSHIQVGELLPLPEVHHHQYQKIHWELERWTLFQGLPNLMKWDQQLIQLHQQMKEGHVKIPDYIKDINPPSLWTYYYTLPKWARDDPVVKNIVMACEYNQPWMPIRAKEQLINYATSMLRPIEPLLKQVLTDAMLSQKTEMNCKLGVTMMQELPFYEVDVDQLGSESEDQE